MHWYTCEAFQQYQNSILLAIWYTYYLLLLATIYVCLLLATTCYYICMPTTCYLILLAISYIWYAIWYVSVLWESLNVYLFCFLGNKGHVDSPFTRKFLVSSPDWSVTLCNIYHQVSVNHSIVFKVRTTSISAFFRTVPCLVLFRELSFSWVPGLRTISHN